MNVQELINSLNLIEDKTRIVVKQQYDSDGCRDGYERIEESVCEVADKWQLGMNPVPINVVEIR